MLIAAICMSRIKILYYMRWHREQLMLSVFLCIQQVAVLHLYDIICTLKVRHRFEPHNAAVIWGFAILACKIMLNLHTVSLVFQWSLIPPATKVEGWQRWRCGTRRDSWFIYLCIHLQLQGDRTIFALTANRWFPIFEVFEVSWCLYPSTILGVVIIHEIFLIPYSLPMRACTSIMRTTRKDQLLKATLNNMLDTIGCSGKESLFSVLG